MSSHLDEYLDFLKNWPTYTALTTNAEVDTNAVTNPVPAGRVMHINSSGKLEYGAEGTEVPVFMVFGSDSPAVTVPSGLGYQGAIPRGKNFGLVGIGPYLLQSTEFDSSEVGNYAYNDPLMAPNKATVGNDETAAGKLYRRKTWDTVGGTPLVAVGTDPVCAVVAEPVKLNHHGRQVLTFWTVYLPV